MKFWQYTGGIGLGFLAFLSVFITGNQEVTLTEDILSPFAMEERLTEGVITAKESARQIYDLDGYFFRLFPGAEMSVQENEISILGGQIWVARVGHFDSRVLKVNGATIDVGDSSVYIDFDQSKRRASLYAVGGAIDLLFSEQNSFSLPIGQTVSFSNQTRLFDSKEIPEFRKKQLLELASWGEEDRADALINLQTVYRHWTERFESYAYFAPYTWSKGIDRGLMSKTSYYLNSIRSNFAVGIPETWREKLFFENTLGLLVDALHFFEVDELQKSEEKIVAFKEKIASPEWQVFLSKNSPYVQDWDLFSLAHQLWLRGLPPTDKRQLFASIWEPVEAADDVDRQLAKSWDGFEYFFSNRFFTEADEQLKAFHEVFKKQKFTEESIPTINRYRFLLGEMILKEPFFQTYTTFDTYETLAQKELFLSTEQSAREQSGIEIAYNLINFSEIAGNKKLDPRVSGIILKVWSLSDIESINKRNKGVILSERDKDLIENIVYASGATLSAEDLAEIGGIGDWEDRWIELVGGNEEDPEEVVVDDKGVLKTAKDLFDFLIEAGVEVDILNFRSSRERGTTSFKKARYKDRLIEANFEYDSQKFLTIQITPGVLYYDIPRFSFETRILRVIDGELQKAQEELDRLNNPDNEKNDPEEDQEEIEPPESDIVQSAAKAKISRRFAQKYLQDTFGLVLDRNKIVVLDDSFATFGIYGGSLGNDIKEVRFDFDQTQGVFENIAWAETHEKKRVVRRQSGRFSNDQFARLLSNIIRDNEERIRQEAERKAKKN